MKKIRAWLSAARLRTLPLSVSGIIAGSAVAYYNGLFSTPIFVLALLTTLGFQILSNFANDYGDGVKGTDNAERIGPARALQSGLLSRKELKYGMIVTAAVTLFIASILIFIAFGNENFLLSFIFFNLGIASIIAAVTYTVGRKAYGYRALGDVFVFIFFGLLAVLGSYFLFSQKLSLQAVFPAVTIGMLSTAVLNLNNMRDRLTDTNAGKNTLAVKLGEKGAKKYHAIIIFVAILSAFTSSFIYAKDYKSYLPLLAMIPIIFNVIKVYKVDSPALLDPELKKVALSTFAYALLFFIILLF